MPYGDVPNTDSISLTSANSIDALYPNPVPASEKSPPPFKSDNVALVNPNALPDVLNKTPSAPDCEPDDAINNKGAFSV